MKLTKYLVKREAYKKFRIKPYRRDFYEELIEKGRIHSSTLVSQEFREINRYMEKEGIKARVEDFSPAGNWGYVNAAKMKFHFKSEGTVSIGSQLFCIVNFESEKVETGCTRLLIRTDVQDFTFLVVPSESPHIAEGRLLLPLMNINFINEDTHITLKGIELSLLKNLTIDWNKIILNHRGIYINRVPSGGDPNNATVPYQPKEGDYILHTPYKICLQYKGKIFWSVMCLSS